MKTSTTKNATKNATSNTTKSTKLYSFDDCMQLFKTYNIGSANDTQKYRIMHGGSSLNVSKKSFKIFSTQIDFDNVVNAKLENVDTLPHFNDCDKKRPHLVECNDNVTLEKLLQVYAKNTLNAPR